MKTVARIGTAEPKVEVTVRPGDVFSARMTLKQWLQALEQVAVLKPGATSRILTNRKLSRIALPKLPPD
jgi:hypothetical protein